MGVVRSQTDANRFSENFISSLKKIRSKIFHFFWSKKYFFKVAKKSNFGNKINFSFVKLMDFVDKNLIFSKKHAFCEKNENQLFFEIFFRPEKMKNFRSDFF